MDTVYQKPKCIRLILLKTRNIVIVHFRNDSLKLKFVCKLL